MKNYNTGAKLKGKGDDIIEIPNLISINVTIVAGDNQIAINTIALIAPLFCLLRKNAHRKREK